MPVDARLGGVQRTEGAQGEWVWRDVHLEAAAGPQPKKKGRSRERRDVLLSIGATTGDSLICALVLDAEHARALAELLWDTADEVDPQGTDDVTDPSERTV